MVQRRAHGRVEAVAVGAQHDVAEVAGQGSLVVRADPGLVAERRQVAEGAGFVEVLGVRPVKYTYKAA